VPVIDTDGFRAVPLVEEPFRHVIVPGFVPRAAMDEILADYPEIARGGSFPLGALDYGPAFAALCDALRGDALRGDALRAAFEAKFATDLSQRPTTLTVRGRCRPKDGRIHTDTRSKLITALVYLNHRWDEEGGRLRLLRSSSDLSDYFAEVPPEDGTMLCFVNAANAWHGHAPFDGVRRVVQLNWVTDEAAVRQCERRHGLSALWKRHNPFRRRS
jgi:hypothetical protein